MKRQSNHNQRIQKAWDPHFVFYVCHTYTTHTIKLKDTQHVVFSAFRALTLNTYLAVRLWPCFEEGGGGERPQTG